MSTLARNTHTTVDATGGPVPMTFPTSGLSDGDPVSLEKTDASTNVVTVTGRIRGVAAQTITLSLYREAISFRYRASDTSWYPVSDHKTLSSLDGRFVQGQAAFQTLMRRLAHGQSSAVTICTDSTDDASNEWGYLLGALLGADFPNFTVQWISPADDSYNLNTPLTVQTGTGGSPPVLTIYNMGIAGSQSYNWQSPTFLAALVAQNPDLILVAAGHNDSTFTGDPSSLGQPQQAFRLRQAVTIEEFRRQLPAVQVAVIAQHEWSDGSGDMGLKRDEWRLLARTCGYGFVDVYQAWEDAGRPAGWYNTGDIVHINSTGEAFYAATIHKAFVYDAKWEPRPGHRTLLENHAANNLADDMVMPSGATVPIGWNLDNATVTRDTRTGYFETPRGYAIRVQPVSTAAGCRIYKQILDSTSIKPYLGQWILVMARMNRPAAGSVPGNRFVGRISVSDGVNNSKTFADDKGFGGPMWRAVPHFVSPTATSLVVSLWTDNNSGGGALNPDVTWDRFMVIPGQWPVGHVSRGSSRMQNYGTAEGMQLGDSTMTTSPDVTLDAAANVTRVIKLRTAGVNRWLIQAQTNETGSNVGSDLAFLARDDAGASIGVPLLISRKLLFAKFVAWIIPGLYATGSRPSASSAGAGAQAFDTTLARPIYSDATRWNVGMASAAEADAVLVAGTKTIADTNITTTSQIILGQTSVGGTPGAVFVSARTAGTGFTITSTNAADTSTVHYWIVKY